MIFDLSNQAATDAFGRRLGALLSPGAVVALSGPLGAGKTHLTRAVAAGAGVRNPAAVTSPTFGLIHEYPGPLPVYHFDAYRLGGPAEFLGLGADEYLAGDGVCVVEWADKVRAALPPDVVRIDIEVTGPDERRLLVAGTGPRSAELVRRLTAPLETAPAGR